ncbi:MAG: glycosyltransferase family 4 protein [Sphingobium sp.]
MNDPQPRLWVVARVHAPDEGGVQTYVREVTETYVRSGWQVTLFAKSSIGPRRVTHDGRTLVDVGPGPVLRVYLRLLRAMIAAWRAGERPAAIHACTWRAAIPALIFPAPLVITVHGREIGRPRKLAFGLMRFVLRRAKRVIAVSNVTRTLLLRRIPSLGPRCRTAWNGVQSHPQNIRRQRENGSVKVISVCRLVPRKNIPVAVRAAAICINRGNPLDYAVIGRGSDEPMVRAEIFRHDWQDRITLAGYVSDEELAEHYRTADIFLHPQIAMEDGAEIEGFGLSIADAMAHGIPCVVGQDGGPAELVRDGVTGLVVDGRSINAITGALDLLARDAALRERLGDNARRWAAQNLSWQQHCAVALAGLVRSPPPSPSWMAEG